MINFLWSSWKPLLWLQSISISHQYPGRVGVLQSTAEQYTVIELTGTDRPGLMSEISALLAEMRCNIVAAELWTHNLRVACLLYITDVLSNGPIEENERLSRIKESLCNVLKGYNQINSGKGAKTDFATSVTHMQRRLHQMMFADRDYEGVEEDDLMWDIDGKITVEDCNEKGYSVVNVECRNRPKLLFDTLCTLTDMEYVIFHATIDTDGQRAFQVCYLCQSMPLCHHHHHPGI